MLESIRRAGESNGAVIECGSGLTTILAGAYASLRGVPYIALEHDVGWGKKVREVLDEFDIQDVNLIIRPLRDYGDYCWYDLKAQEGQSKWAWWSVTDRPGDTPGGRYGFLPGLQTAFRAGTVILIDDIVRLAEWELVDTVKSRFNTEDETSATASSFAVLVISPD